MLDNKQLIRHFSACADKLERKIEQGKASQSTAKVSWLPSFQESVDLDRLVVDQLLSGRSILEVVTVLGPTTHEAYEVANAIRVAITNGKVLGPFPVALEKIELAYIISHFDVERWAGTDDYEHLKAELEADKHRLAEIS
jgi:hypothetical protein